MANPIVRAAVVQAASVIFDTPRTLAKLVNLTEIAAASGAQIIVFPEAFVGGYPKGLDFGARLGMRSSEGREDFRRYYESSITVPGPEMLEMAEVARRNSLHLVVGVIERDGGTLYCTALMFGPDGSLLGRHRKLMPTAFERLVWGVGDGSTITVADSAIGHYARPDIFNLSVDTRPKSPVCFAAESLEGTSFSCQPHTIAEATEGSQRC